MFSISDEDLSCPVCHDIFKDPVVLSCSHSFCKACVQMWWKGKQVLECPCCKTRSPSKEPPRNLALKNLCEAASRRDSTGSEAVCTLHSEKLRLFCLDHKEAVCLICRDSRRHTNHTFRPIDEAARDQRVELQKVLKPLRERRSQFEEAKENCAQTAKHVNVQARQTERKIREDFEKIKQFLKKEEEARVAALREEEERKSRMINKKMEDLNKEIAALSHVITSTERELRTEDASFLMNYKATVERVQQRPLGDGPEPLPFSLIDVAKHLGNLTFNVWSRMKKLTSYFPVILDPNTADPELIAADDLSGVRSGRRQQLPKNPERTKFCCCILGSEGFTSGTHSWDIDVGQNKDWELGVLGEDSQKKEQSGLWRILFSDGNLSVFSSLGSEYNMPQKSLERVRVQLEFDGGTLSFFDLDTNTLIHAFKQTFNGRLFPYIYTENHPMIKILPVPVKVMLEKHT